MEECNGKRIMGFQENKLLLNKACHGKLKIITTFNNKPELSTG